MEDVFSKEQADWRAIHSETIHHIMYVFLITWELTIAILLLTGLWAMIKNLKSAPEAFNQSKNGY